MREDFSACRVARTHAACRCDQGAAAEFTLRGRGVERVQRQHRLHFAHAVRAHQREAARLRGRCLPAARAYRQAHAGEG